MFSGQSIQLVRLSDSVAEVRFERANQSVNKFDSATVAELREVTGLLRADSSIAGVLVTSAKPSFIVGADIFEFTGWYRQTAAAVSGVMGGISAAFTAFEDLPIPIVVAINGIALGGGFEMAMTGDYRIMADVAQVGLPEVSLGLFPGFGGCVRLPRLIGGAAAAEWIASGKPQKPAAALKAGAVDEIVPLDKLRDAALLALEAAMVNGEWRTQREARRGAVIEWDAAAFALIKESAGKTARHYPAALAAVEVVESTRNMLRDAALAVEAASFGRVATTATSAALIQLFINDQSLKKKANARARVGVKVNRAAVLGAGIMGGGIAYTSAARGISVRMKDIAQTALDVGKAEARKLIDKQVAAGRLTTEAAAAVDASIIPTLDYADFESVDVVIEAVVENLDVKRRVLAEVEAAVSSDAVLASNTSSLSITAMATALQRPENFAGMHFFNPVPLMPLVEVIRGEKTSESAAATIAAYASAMGKTSVIVRECPGFLVNRILTPYVIGFLKLLHHGANFERVDQVMEEFGWPMGPAFLLDVIGLDTAAHVFGVIVAGYPQRMRLDFPDAIHVMVDHQRLGQKNGVGFYRYQTNAKGRPEKSSAPEAHTLLARIQPQGAQEFGAEDIIDSLMLPMVLEAAVCLEEGVVDTAAEVDMSLVLGLGFPRYLGGPLKYADVIGLDTVVAKCERHALLAADAPILATLRKMAQSGARFHG